MDVATETHNLLFIASSSSCACETPLPSLIDDPSVSCGASRKNAATAAMTTATTATATAIFLFPFRCVSFSAMSMAIDAPFFYR